MASEVQTQSTGSRPVQDLIGIAENVTTTADPAGLMRALAQASVMTLKNPAGVVAANARLAWGSVGALRATAERSIGRDRSGPIAISRSDKRFADPAFARQSAVLPAGAAVPACRPAGHRAARCGRAGRQAGDQGALRREVHARRARADQHAARQPRGAAAGLRHRRQERGPGREEHAGRHPPQRRLAVAGRRSGFEVGVNMARHARGRWSTAATSSS